MDNLKETNTRYDEIVETNPEHDYASLNDHLSRTHDASDAHETSVKFVSEEREIGNSEEREIGNYVSLADRAPAGTYNILAFRNEASGRQTNVDERGTFKRKMIYLGLLISVVFILVIVVTVAICIFTEKGNCTEQINISNGKIVNKTGSIHGDSFDVLCNDGHQISGPTSVTCLSSNKWSKHPTCDCREFQKAPQNGRISAITETNIIISCNAGYILTGAFEIHRLSNGCWTKGPVCERRCTIQPGQFTGNLSYTTGGYTCQRWDSQSPHEHTYWRDYLFLDGSASAAENHCRALGEDYLWCYTTNSSVRWKNCTKPDYVC